MDVSQLAFSSSVRLRTGGSNVRPNGQFNRLNANGIQVIGKKFSGLDVFFRNRPCGGQLQCHGSEGNFSPRGQSEGRLCSRLLQNRPVIVAEPDRSNTVLEKMFRFSDVLSRFVRPYVIFGSIVGYIGILARTWMGHPHPLGWSQLLKAMVCLSSLVCAECYINGINQIFDVEIDRINKPYLPIASGELSIELAWLLVTTFAAVGLATAAALNYGPFTSSVCGFYFLGTIYSVPPFSMKRSTLGVILLCVLGRGCVWTLAASSAARASLQVPFVLSKPIIFMIVITSLYSSAIVIVKDLADLEGDRKNDVPTLATIIGARNVAFIGCGLLMLNYIGAISAAILLPQIFKRSVVIPAHTLFALYLIILTRKVDKANYKKEESQAFYQFMWKMMWAEYVLFPFI